MSKFGEKEQIFVHALTTGQSISDAAKLAGIGRTTAHRWMERPEIQVVLHPAIEKVQQQVECSAAEIIISKYREALEPACDVVVSIVNNPMESGATRLKAIQMIQDRLAPILKQPEQQPEQNEIIPRDLLQYATDEEIEQMYAFVEMLQVRRTKAEQDRARLHA